MRWSTRLRRWSAFCGFSSGSYRLGEEIIPASSAASSGVTSFARRAFGSSSSSGSVGVRVLDSRGRGALLLLGLVAVAEVGAHRGLDAVGAVPEIDGVQVLGEDLVLRPLALEVIGERRLAQFLEHRAVALGRERVLHELLRDRRAALRRSALQHVLHERARDAGVVDALVLVEAPVLDRDHGVLDVGRDLALLEQDAVLVAGQRGDLAVDVAGPPAAGPVRVEDGVAGGPVLGAVLERGQVARHGHQHPEDGRDDRQQADAEQDEGEPQLLQLRLAARGRRRRDARLRGPDARRRLLHRGSAVRPQEAASARSGLACDGRRRLLHRW